MSSNVFNELLKKDFDICGVTKRLTKKGVDNLFTVEAKDFIRSSPDAILVGVTCRPIGNQYLFTYEFARGKNGLCHKNMTYIPRYQMVCYFKEVENL